MPIEHAIAITLHNWYSVHPPVRLSMLAPAGSRPDLTFVIDLHDHRKLVVYASALERSSDTFVIGLTLVEGANKPKGERKWTEVEEFRLPRWPPARQDPPEGG